MAVIEFFKIKLMDRDNKEKKMDFSKLCKDRLQNMTDSEKYCTHSSCDASMVDYIENEDSITFDFIKFKKEIIHSTIISKPGDEQDTFEALNTNIIDSIKYTKDDLKTVKKIIKKEFISIEDIKKKLENTSIDKFAIYKMIIENDKLEVIEDNERLSTLFYEANLERLRKFKTFFNLIYINDKYNIMLLEKNKDGFDYRKLQEYLNRYFFKEEEFTVYIELIYDNNFLKILKDSVLERFKFTIDFRENSILESEDLTNFFGQLSQSLGQNKITITSDSHKNSSLNNEKIIDFFSLLSESGLLESAKVKTKGSRREVDSLSRGEILLYSDSQKLETLDNANRIFQKAIDMKKDIMDDEIWK